MAMRRHLFTCSLVAVFAVWGFWPAVYAYTFAYGERASATVERCERHGSGRFTGVTCHGTWRTGDGERGAGQIYGLSGEQREETVPVRIGPMGPYANGWDRAWPLPVVTGALTLIPITVFAWVRRRYVLPARKLSEALQAAPGDIFVISSRDGVRRPDGSSYAVPVGIGPEPPPGHRYLELPGRPRTDRAQPALASRESLHRFETIADTAGRPLMHVEHRSDRGLHPEHVLLAPSGAPSILVRTDPGRAHAYRLLDGAGTVIAFAGPVEGRNVLTLGLSDAAGRPVATAAKKRGRWVLRVEPETSPLWRDAAIALVLIRMLVIN
ncbi:hypothetical protein [Actinomadura rifamycini]|uniref:hypothetical protein n=1 Tax=Actinomadura rifamycini TaxID=31962 RepID=UPI0003FB928D|nr:hypothetical protein [Actinomadura rifamycini]